MRRRSFLCAAAGTAVGLAGCTATAIPGAGGPDTPTPRPDCPALLEPDRTVCPRRTDGPLRVLRSDERVSGVGWTLGVTVTNTTASSYRFDPYGWSVFRQAGDAWERVAPDAHGEPVRELAPGDHFIWQLTTTEPDLSNADQRVFLDLGPGAYAFAVPFRGPDQVGAVAPFAIAG